MTFFGVKEVLLKIIPTNLFSDPYCDTCEKRKKKNPKQFFKLKNIE